MYEQTGGNRKLKNQDGGLKTSNTYISACTQGSKDIITALPMFSESGNTNRLMQRLLDEWIYEESKLARLNCRLKDASFLIHNWSTRRAVSAVV